MERHVPSGHLAEKNGRNVPMRSKFLINHVGYMPNASKRLVYTGEADSFTVCRFQDLIFTPVLEAPLQADASHEWFQAKVGDFSAVTEPGIYRISTSEGNSRCFIINENVYDTAARVMTGFFTWQRCSDKKGWNGVCHTDDSIQLENGEKRDLTGGHHQSSDLRKWIWGTSMGMAGYMKWALLEKPEWDDGIVEEEIWHAAKYYLSLITDEGWLIDCVWVPESYDGSGHGTGYGNYVQSWENRRYYASPAPEPGHWWVIQSLALAARRLSDPEKSARCLEGAKHVFKYMCSLHNGHAVYTLPELPPLGHDGMHKFFGGFYEDSAQQLACKANAAMELWQTEPLDEYREIAKQALRKLSGIRITGEDNDAAGSYWEGSRRKCLSDNNFYFHNTSVPMSFVNALELWKDDPDAEIWMENAKEIAARHECISRRNPFGRIPATWFAEGHNAFAEPGCFSFSEENKNEGRKDYTAGFADDGAEKLPVHYAYYGECYNLNLIAGAVFLAKLHKFTGEPRYKALMQRQLDWIMGANMYDASSIEAVGYNQPHRGIFGEFFPPVPQIPGAICTGLADDSFTEVAFGFDCEYDMPMVGWGLYLLACIKNMEG